jgi:hypothetical protein
MMKSLSAVAGSVQEIRASNLAQLKVERKNSAQSQLKRVTFPPSFRLPTDSGPKFFPFYIFKVVIGSFSRSSIVNLNC